MGLQPIQSLYSTGINDFRNSLPGGSLDFHYLTSPAPLGQSAYVTDTSTLNWITPWDKSRWISPNTDPGTPMQTVTYRTVFNLDRFDASTASIQGEWVASGSGKIYLNGLLLPVINNGQRSMFSIAGPFNKQFNELAFEVRSDAKNNNGLLVSMTGTALSVPEPSGFIATAIGLVAAAIGLRWKKRQK